MNKQLLIKRLEKLVWHLKHTQATYMGHDDKKMFRTLLWLLESYTHSWKGDD